MDNVFLLFNKNFYGRDPKDPLAPLCGLGEKDGDFKELLDDAVNAASGLSFYSLAMGIRRRAFAGKLPASGPIAAACTKIMERSASMGCRKAMGMLARMRVFEYGACSFGAPCREVRLAERAVLSQDQNAMAAAAVALMHEGKARGYAAFLYVLSQKVFEDKDLRGFLPHGDFITSVLMAGEEGSDREKASFDLFFGSAGRDGAGDCGQEALLMSAVSTLRDGGEPCGEEFYEEDRNKAVCEEEGRSDVAHEDDKAFLEEAWKRIAASRAGGAREDLCLALEEAWLLKASRIADAKRGIAKDPSIRAKAMQATASIRPHGRAKLFMRSLKAYASLVFCSDEREKHARICTSPFEERLGNRKLGAAIAKAAGILPWCCAFGCFGQMGIGHGMTFEDAEIKLRSLDCRILEIIFKLTQSSGDPSVAKAGADLEIARFLRDLRLNFLDSDFPSSAFAGLASEVARDSDLVGMMPELLTPNRSWLRSCCCGGLFQKSIWMSLADLKPASLMDSWARRNGEAASIKAEVAMRRSLRCDSIGAIAQTASSLSQAVSLSARARAGMLSALGLCLAEHEVPCKSIPRADALACSALLAASGCGMAGMPRESALRILLFVLENPDLADMLKPSGPCGDLWQALTPLQSAIRKAFAVLKKAGSLDGDRVPSLHRIRRKRFGNAALRGEALSVLALDGTAANGWRPASPGPTPQANSS